MNSVTRAALAVALASACSSDSHRSPPEAAPAPHRPAVSSNQVTPVTSPPPMLPSSPDPIVPKLVADAYGDPWNHVDRDERIDAIWGEAGAARLRAIVADDGAPLKARLVACEVLFKRDSPSVWQVGKGKVAQLYARALAENATGFANAWGLLYEHNDAGPLGLRFLQLGTDAIPALRPLLADERRTLVYDGSEEATVGNGYGYRVKDFAAFYLGRIVKAKLPYQRDVAARDRAIADLERSLPSP